MTETASGNMTLRELKLNAQVLMEDKDIQLYGQLLLGKEKYETLLMPQLKAIEDIESKKDDTSKD